jgi:Amidohydrolase family
VTTVGLAFQGGIFPGQTAAVSTGTRAVNLTGPGTPAIMGRPTGSDIAANDASSLVLRTPVALQVAFNPRRGTYPGTLMGTIAYVRQAFLDADYQIRAQQAFQRSPASAPRPEFDAQSRALAGAVAGNLPVWFVANRERDIKRTIELATELNVKDYALLGLQEGWLSLDDLKATRKPLVVSLDFPRPTTITGRAYENHVKPVSGEDRVAAQLDSTAARNARANAASLAKAGLNFALTGYGISAAADFRRNLIAAVDAGLNKDDALRALTTTPAQLLGLSNVVGTIEPGKLANLVAVEGDLFATQGKIREVFVEGRRYLVREAPADSTRRGGRDSARPATIAGDWNGHVEVPNSGTTEFVLTLTVNGNQVRGALKLEGMAEAPLTGELNGADVVLNGAITPPNGNSMTISITARVTGDDLKGTLSGQGISSRPFEARRQTQ